MTGRIWLACLAVLACAPALFGQRAVTQADFAALSSATCTPYVNVATARSYPDKYTVEFAVTGSPTTCSMHLEGTIDPLIRQTEATGKTLSGSESCTADGMFHVINRPVRWVRVCLDALAGGTSPSVDAKYLGVSQGN